eukprot:GHVR01137178.1.p1 GENE.GHVR01137178.1~~GHVR01137178.1.p1  ORF type:complete len:226 (+),score=15.64 GHVR01137178.1:97-774(+)
MQNDFTRKLIYTFCLQVLVTALISGTMCLVPAVNKFFRTNFFIGFAVCLIIAVIVLIYIFFESAARKFPINMILLGIFTVCEGIALGYLCHIHEWTIPLVATGLLVLGLAAFALTTKMDITGHEIYLLAVFLAFAAIAIVILIWEFYFNIKLSFVQQMLSAAYLTLFSLYLVFEVQIIQFFRALTYKGLDKEFYVDDYVAACLMVYTDFPCILGFLGVNNISLVI